MHTDHTRGNHMTAAVTWMRIRVLLAFALFVLVIGPGCGSGSGTKCNTIGSGPTFSDFPLPEPVPLSRYAGTWKGTWQVFNSLEGTWSVQGPMTLTVDKTGNLSGQWSSTKTGQTATLVGKLKANRSGASLEITTTIGEQSLTNTSECYLSPSVAGSTDLDDFNTLGGNMWVPPGATTAPVDPDSPDAVISTAFGLTRQ